MKKNYFEPQAEIVELETFGFLATSGLDNIDNGGSDGSVSGSDKEPSDTDTPGWDFGF